MKIVVAMDIAAIIAAAYAAYAAWRAHRSVEISRAMRSSSSLPVNHDKQTIITP